MYEKTFFKTLIKNAQKAKDKEIASPKRPVKVDFEALIAEIELPETIESSIKTLVSCFQQQQIESVELVKFENLNDKQQTLFINELDQITYPTYCEGYEDVCSDLALEQKIQALVGRNLFLSCYPKPNATENQPVNLRQCVIDHLLPSPNDAVFNAHEISFFRPNISFYNAERTSKINAGLLLMGRTVFPEYIEQLAGQLNQKSSYRVFKYRPADLTYNRGNKLNPNVYLGKEALQSLIDNSAKLRCFKEFHLDVRLSDDINENQLIFNALEQLMLRLEPEQRLCVYFRSVTGAKLPSQPVVEFLQKLTTNYKNNKHTAGLVVKDVYHRAFDYEDFENFELIQKAQATLYNVIMQNRRQLYADSIDKPMPPSTELPPTAYDNFLSPDQFRPSKKQLPTKIRRCKRETEEQRRSRLQQKVQFQHQFQQQTHQQTKRQRQQHIEQQSAQTVYAQADEKGLIDRTRFTSADNVTSYENNNYFRVPPSRQQQLANYWDTAFGRVPSEHLPTFLTPAANQQLVNFLYLFRGGMLDDTNESLPEGFFYRRTKNNALVLDFDARHVSEDIKVSAFVVKCRQSQKASLHNLYKKDMGSIEQFNGPVPEEQTRSFKKLCDGSNLEFLEFNDAINVMQLVDKGAAEEIKNGYAGLLQSVAAHRELAQLAVEQGCGAVKKLLANLKPIYESDQKQWKIFCDSFLSKDAINEFLCEENRIIIENITQLATSQRTWWWTLVKQHMQAAQGGHLGDLFTAFNAFCQSYEQLAKRHHLPLDLPDECNFENVTSLPVCLGRLEFILKQAERSGHFAEQIDKLQGLDLGSQGAYYPMRYLNYGLVTKEMGWSQQNFALNTKASSLSAMGSCQELPFFQPEHTLHYHDQSGEKVEAKNFPNRSIVIAKHDERAYTYNAYYTGDQWRVPKLSSNFPYELYYFDTAERLLYPDYPKRNFIVINQDVANPPAKRISFIFAAANAHIPTSYSFELRLSEQELAYLNYYSGDSKVVPHDPEIYDGIINKCLVALEQKFPDAKNYLASLSANQFGAPLDHLQINLSGRESALLAKKKGEIERTSKNSKIFDQLMERIALGFDVNLTQWDVKKIFYRFVGEQQSRPPMAHFDDLFNQLMQFGERSNHPLLARQLLVVLAKSSVNERVEEQHQTKELAALLAFLKLQLANDLNRDHVIEIIKFFCQTGVVSRFRFEEITALIKGMLDALNKAEVVSGLDRCKGMSMKECQALLSKQVQSFGDSFARGVLNWADYDQPPTREHLRFEQYLLALEALTAVSGLTQQQKGRIAMSIGGMPSSYFQIHRFTKFLESLSKLPPPKIQAITYVWSRLDIKEISRINSRSLSLIEIEGLITEIEKNPETDYQSIANIIVNYFGNKGYQLLPLEEIAALSTHSEPAEDLKEILQQADESEKNWSTLANDLPEHLARKVDEELKVTKIGLAQQVKLRHLLGVKLLPNFGKNFSPESFGAIQAYLTDMPVIVKLLDDLCRINPTAFIELSNFLGSDACVVKGEVLMRLLSLFFREKYYPPMAVLERLLSNPAVVGGAPIVEQQKAVLMLMEQCGQSATGQAKVLNEKLLSCVLGSLTHINRDFVVACQKLVKNYPETAAAWLDLWSNQLAHKKNQDESLKNFLKISETFFTQYENQAGQLATCLSYLLCDAAQTVDLLTALVESKNYEVLRGIFAGLAKQKTFDAGKVKQIIGWVEKLSEVSQRQLLALYQTSPVPTLLQLHSLLKNSSKADNFTTLVEQFIEEFKRHPFGERDLEAQFDMSQVERVLKEMQVISPDLEGKRNLTESERQTLFADIVYINALGYLYPYTNDKPINRLSDEELLAGWQHERDLVRQSETNPAEKHEARLRALALVREIFFRASYQSGKPLFPNSTQMIALLLEVSYPDSNLGLEIPTGEGKSLIAVLSAALATLERDEPVDLHTPRRDLALRDAEKAGPFFALLGENFHAALLESNVERQGNNLAYATPTDQTLRDEALDVKGETEVYGTSIDDEPDFNRFEDSVHRRFGVTFDVVIEGDEDSFVWLYRHLNAFILTKEFNLSGATEADDVANFIHYLNHCKEVTLKQKRQLQRQVTYERLDQWLNSAYDASLLRPDLDYICKPALITDKGSDGQPIPSQATLLVHSEKVLGAEYEGGVQQCLLSRLNDARAETQARYLLKPEVTNLVSMTDHDFHRLYRRHIGLSGTLGSREQRRELAEKLPDRPMRMFRIPGHQPEQRNDQFVLVADENERKAKMLADVRAHLSKGKPWFFGLLGKNVPPQPMLIHCKTIQEAEEWYALLKQELAHEDRMTGLQLYTAKSAKSYTNSSRDEASIAEGTAETDVTDRAGIAGMITLSTLMKRGTHITPRLQATDETQTHPDGLAVFGHFDSPNQMKQQIRRAARQGHPGGSITYITCAELELPVGKKLSDETLKLQVKARQKSLETIERQQRLIRERESVLTNHLRRRVFVLRNAIPDPTQQMACMREWAKTMEELHRYWAGLIEAAPKEGIDEEFTDKLARCSKEYIEQMNQYWGKFVELYERVRNQAAHYKLVIMEDIKNPCARKNEFCLAFGENESLIYSVVNPQGQAICGTLPSETWHSLGEKAIDAIIHGLKAKDTLIIEPYLAGILARAIEKDTVPMMKNAAIEPLLKEEITIENAVHKRLVPPLEAKPIPEVEKTKKREPVQDSLVNAEKQYLLNQLEVAYQQLGPPQIKLEPSSNIAEELNHFFAHYITCLNSKQLIEVDNLALLTTQKMLLAIIDRSQSLMGLRKAFISQQKACLMHLLDKQGIPLDFLRVYQSFVASILPESSFVLHHQEMGYGTMRTQLNQYLSYWLIPEAYKNSAKAIGTLLDVKAPKNNLALLRACIEERKKVVAYALQRDREQLFGFSLSKSRYHAHLDGWIERLELAISLDEQQTILNHRLNDVQNMLALALGELGAEGQNRLGLNAFNHFAANNDETIDAGQIIRLNKLLRQQHTAIESLPNNLRYLLGLLARQCECIYQYRNNEMNKQCLNEVLSTTDASEASQKIMYGPVLPVAKTESLEKIEDNQNDILLPSHKNLNKD